MSKKLIFRRFIRCELNNKSLPNQLFFFFLLTFIMATHLVLPTKTLKAKPKLTWLPAQVGKILTIKFIGN